MNFKINELRIGNKLKHGGVVVDIDARSIFDIWDNDGITKLGYEAIPFTEDWLSKFGFTVITEGSTGRAYAYIINNSFSSDLVFTFWNKSKYKGKIFRNDLEIKSVHQLQNLYFSLTGEELEFKN